MNIKIKHFQENINILLSFVCSASLGLETSSQKLCKLVSWLWEQFASIWLISSSLGMGAQKQSTRTESRPRVANLEQVQQLTQIHVAGERH